jgi:DNA mismatch repair protein MSH5
MELSMDDDEIQNEFVLSVCWDTSTLSATYFDLLTRELHVRNFVINFNFNFTSTIQLLFIKQVMNEMTDLKSEHLSLKNLFQEVEPSYFIASGSKAFLDDVTELLSLSEDIIKNMKDKKSKSKVGNLAFYTLNRKSQCEEYRKQIYEIEFPGLPAQATAKERQIAINSILPMNQELTVIALGNLLRFLKDNYLKWRHIFRNLDHNIIIFRVLVHSMESHVLVSIKAFLYFIKFGETYIIFCIQIDETTFNSLNIFSCVYHPSNFKKQMRRDGLSIFNMLNECSSSVGVQELKSFLKTPIRDLDELNIRHSTIEWCLEKRNFGFVVNIKKVLKNILNVSVIFNRIFVDQGRHTDWTSFRKAIYTIIQLIELSSSLENIDGTIFEELAENSKFLDKFREIIGNIDEAVDVERMEKKRRFTVKEGFINVLDSKREELDELNENFLNLGPDDALSVISQNRNDFGFIFHDEKNEFLIAAPSNFNQNTIDLLKTENIELVFFDTVNSTALFQTPNSQLLDKIHEKLATEIINIEVDVSKEILKLIKQSIHIIIQSNILCAKLDVLVSLASVAGLYNFVRPEFVDKKEINIIKGRHPLIELSRQFIPNTTIINEQNRKFVNVINAPNSSGKSIYIKSIATICYLAHIGSFIPADKCEIMLLDAIYTRIHTPESVYQGESAFLADLQQVSKVVMNSTTKSLLLIDEFGKGTNEKDGLALLIAIIEHFCSRNMSSPIVFIITHFHSIFEILRPSFYLNRKSIKTEENERKIFQSTYEVVDGELNNQQRMYEYPESERILSNLFYGREEQ